mmetsp:Transcript_19042/g.48707  ORF Transcript_19042/g.48707 Transcript_19042/m.48707 type:complete len:164 (-) Transcript_19042:153-644(-)
MNIVPPHQDTREKATKLKIERGKTKRKISVAQKARRRIERRSSSERHKKKDEMSECVHPSFVFFPVHSFSFMPSALRPLPPSSSLNIKIKRRGKQHRGEYSIVTLRTSHSYAMAQHDAPSEPRQERGHLYPYKRKRKRAMRDMCLMAQRRVTTPFRNGYLHRV